MAVALIQLVLAGSCTTDGPLDSSNEGPTTGQYSSGSSISLMAGSGSRTSLHVLDPARPGDVGAGSILQVCTPATGIIGESNALATLEHLSAAVRDGLQVTAHLQRECSSSRLSDKHLILADTDSPTFKP